MRTERTIVVGGGGSEREEANVLEKFATIVGQAGRVLTIPWAQSEPDVSATTEWATKVLSTYGIARVETALVSEQPSPRLDAYDGFFIPGGNTYLLLHRLRSTNFGAQVIHALRHGMPCYGGSAGAIVLGSNIGTCAHMDANTVNLTDLRGLDLVDGYAVWCHYVPSQGNSVAQFATATGHAVIAVPENAGVVSDGSQPVAIGPGTVQVFTPTGEHVALPTRAPA